MRNRKKAGFRKLSGMNKVSLNADKHEGRFMHRAMKSMPWLICASAAWLTLVPCEMAFAADPPAPDDENVLYNKIGVDTGGTVDGGQLVIDQSVADKAVSQGKWYLTSNWAKAGNATEGHTTIQSGVTIDNIAQRYISGSLSSNGTATNSSVTATNAILNGDIVGGDGHKGASDNIVELTDHTKVSRSVIGGRVQDNVGGNDAALYNRVSMSGSTAYEVRGGYTLYGNAIHNQVFLEANSIVSGLCSGGYTSSGTADSNEVHLNSSSASVVFGGGDYILQKGDVLNNIVTLENGSNASSVYGGFTLQGNADGNKVTGSDSSISFAVYGGWGTTGASNNKVELDNVTVSGTVTGGKTDSGDASANTVILSRGTTYSYDLYARLYR